ncbi:MAG: hypothetical protein AAF553_06710 [Pseudomonadota bacterium]
MTIAKVLTLNAYTVARERMEAMSSVIVLACGAALIFAGQPIPL